MSIRKLLLSAGTGLLTLTLAAQTAARANDKHVLLISVDGLHASDLTNYVASHPQSALASLAQRGAVYPNAFTSAPSDSFPGLLAQVTGGTPRSHGVFYDVSYDRTLFAPMSNCQGAPGTQTVFDNTVDYDPTVATGGGQLGKPQTQINPANLPMGLRNGVCVPIYPHDFVKVNTIFEVIHASGRRTAWADKHPAYDLVNGPSGQGVDDLFTPEVDSNDAVTGQGTTNGFHSIQRNDSLKVQAVLNEIAGLDSTGQTYAGVPAIFGMNFQAVSVGQKLAKGNAADPQDAGLVGGYADRAGKTPNNGLQGNLDYVDQQLASMVSALANAGLTQTTAVIISAKHGQSPIDVTQRKAFSDAPYPSTPGYAASITDDVGLVWLTPSLQTQDYNAAKSYLNSQASALGISLLLDQNVLSRYYRDPLSDNRTPDFIAITQQGLIYTGGSKLAEHGGFANNDRNVAILVALPAAKASSVSTSVETRQIAPTILDYLGLDPQQLQSSKIEPIAALPGLGF